MKCEKCGRELKDDVIVCDFCGKAIPTSHLSEEVKNRIKIESTKDVTPSMSPVGERRSLGYTLVTIGIIADVISMILIASGVYEIGFVTVAGTIAFLIGIALMR